MEKSVDPFDLWRTGVELGALMVETQMVMAYRFMGMAGLWAVAKTENQRMVDEKAPAFAEAAIAAGVAVMQGQGPDKVVGAWVRPLRSKTSSNMRRLGQRGFVRR
ncbi:antifreeze protein [Roseitranquillus sediminis]|uniref:antifreeze protein n=1 Tax=Roseitranquillus sediminis TaxID=2809051 RepID=UPI001D0CC05F|nr:antifreeze protein [Roseitranquillus sediminis]MBM9594246.1 antifreeze protein [Roseitranquillus sediminis]